MSQPTVTTYDRFVFDESRRLGKAWFDANPQDWFAHLTADQQAFLFEKVGELSWRRLADEKAMRQILTEIGVDPADYGEPLAPELPLSTFPRLGLSIASVIVNTQYDLAELAERYQDAGVQLTRINLLSALWPGVDCLPFLIPPVGVPFDLYQWDNRHFERLDEARERLNAIGCVVIWTGWELYSWSNRKGFKSVGVRDHGVPDANLGPWRHNLNNLRYGGLYNGDRKQDDETLGAGHWNTSPNAIPGAWGKAYLSKAAPFLGLTVNILETANEMPEKGLHQRVRDAARAAQAGALIGVNRQEDTPGQYANMQIGSAYDFIELHGRLLKHPDDLDRPYADEPTYQTFRDFFDRCPHDPRRIIFSSDGARSSAHPENTYDWGPLREFVQEVHGVRKCSFEHQSRAKMTPPPNYQMIETEWFQSLRS